MSGDNTVFITQDKEGLIWVATTDGLNRYDGYQVRNFFHRPQDSHSLLSNNVNSLAAAGDNGLWITTTEGISYYDKTAGRFINFKREKSTPPGITSNVFQSIYINPQDNEAWTSGYGYFYHVNKHGSLTPQRLILSASDTVRRLPQNASFFKDRSGRLFAFDSSCLFEFDRDGYTIHHTAMLDHWRISAMYQDQQGRYWLGTVWGGIYNFDPITHAFNLARVHTSGSIVYSITGWKDKSGNDWLVFGTEKGITLVNPQTLASKNFMPKPFDNQSLIGAEVHCVFTDRQNILWVATDKGVSYAEPSGQLISTRSITPSGPGASNSEVLNPGFLYSAHPGPEGDYYACNFDAPGLFRFTEDGPVRRTLANLCPWLPDSLKIYTDKAYDILQMPDGSCWVSTDLGFVHCDFEKKTAVLYKAPFVVSPAGLRTILRFNDSLCWIRSRNNSPNGIYVFNLHSKKFVAHYHPGTRCAGCLPPRLTDMIMASNRKIYSTPVDNYIWSYDSIKDRFIPLVPDAASRPFPSAVFNCLAENPDGNLWIGMSNGLILFDPVKRTILRDFSTDRQLGGVDVSQICLDENNNVWMTTERGLFCLLNKTDAVYNFTTGDGLPTNSFPGLLVRGRNHDLLAGATGYLVKFHPAELLNRRFSGNARFTDVAVMGVARSWETGKEGQRLITLSPGQHTFSVDYTVLNYDHAAGNRYYYRLNGIDNEWKENANGHLNFYNLPPGRYSLRVKGGDKYGGLFAGEDTLLIIARPFWWQTSWFILLCAVIAICLSAVFIGRRIRSIRREASINQKIAETEMMALRAQMNPHFLFNSMNSIENFILQHEPRLAGEYMNKFARLIRIILDSSRNELVNLAKDLEALQLYVDLEQLRFNHKFVYKTNIDPALLQDDFQVPPLLIQPIVENAIVHGLAPANKRGLELRVQAVMEGEYILYTVEDNGIGRRNAAACNEPYKSSHAGVGLLITRERVNLFNRKHWCNGDIRIIDLFDKHNKPAGTRVEIKIKPF